MCTEKEEPEIRKSKAQDYTKISSLAASVLPTCGFEEYLYQLLEEKHWGGELLVGKVLAMQTQGHEFECPRTHINSCHGGASTFSRTVEAETGSLRLPDQQF